MKLRERRLVDVESRIPNKAADKNAAVAAMLTWALSLELDALAHLLERHHRGRSADGDDALLEDLAAIWQARADDPAVEASRIHDATRRWHRDPDRRLIGGQWISWLSDFNARDADGETTADDWATWHKLMTAIERFIIRLEPLPEGVSWGPDGMPAAVLQGEAA